MRRTAILLASIALALLLAGGVALAITNGTPDNKSHPNVGALVNINGFSDGTYTYCTGTLISPTIFLTAAHCDPSRYTGDTAYVTFDSEYTRTSKLYSGTFVPHDQYKFTGQLNPYDIAVVKLDAPISSITPAQLPAYYQFDTAAKGDKFTAVGYGAVKADTQPGGPSSIVYDDVRRYAVSTLKSVNREYLHLSQNNANDEYVGGTCSGDSGGPNFLGAYENETDIIAGITITGDAYCNSTNVVNRLDTDTARVFLRQFEDEGVTVP